MRRCATLRLARTEYLQDAEVEVDLAIENIAGAPVEVDSMVLVSQPLLVDVRNATGASVPVGPPPMPSGQVRTIGPRETVHTKIVLAPLPPGEYRICARGWASNTIRFRITADR